MNNHHCENNLLSQWHETKKIKEGEDYYFIKKYNPGSYEIKNELSWLNSTMLRAGQVFDIPDVVSASISEGWVKMLYVDKINEMPSKDITDWLIKSAIQIHSVLKSDKPHLRCNVSKGEYVQYVIKYVRERLKTVEASNFELAEGVADWIMKRINSLKTDYFTIVHRDLRGRHLLFRKNQRNPVLVDWEFSNISDPSQDLAKLIYDATVDRGLDRNRVMRYVIDTYAHERKISADCVEEKIRTFLPVIPLEHAMSFINRRPDGYKMKVLADLSFIKVLHDEEK